LLIETCGVSTVAGVCIPAAPEYAFYLHVQALQGHYQTTLRQAEELLGITQTTSPTTYLFALGAKTLALLQLGRFGEVPDIVRNGMDVAEKNGNAPWLFVFPEAWLRTLCFDFEGVRRLSQILMRVNPELHAHQPRTIAKARIRLRGTGPEKYDQALDYFAQVRDRRASPDFFLHWYWRMHAQLGSARVWLRAGNLANAVSGGHYSHPITSDNTPRRYSLRVSWERKKCGQVEDSCESKRKKTTRPA
jgi:hypothetical protein